MNKDINIWWEGPFSKEAVVDNKIDSNEYDNTADRIGLYQIYGTHPLYGNDVLLYIGRTKNNNGFASRLNNRWETIYDSDNANVKIYLGTIFTDTENNLTTEEEYEQIEYAEVLLINAMKPALNSSNIKSVGKKYIDINKNYLDKSYSVNNLNNYKSIYPQLTSGYYWNNFLNIHIVEQLAEIQSVKVKDTDEIYGFDIKENDNIFFGIDYKIWNDENIPLVFGIYKEAINESSLNESSLFEYVCKDEDYYYLAITSNLKDEKVIENIQKQLDKIVNFLETNTN